LASGRFAFRATVEELAGDRAQEVVSGDARGGGGASGGGRVVFSQVLLVDVDE
jgi:hypothetical protein